jgi:Fe-S-cluster containining protein
MPSKRAWNLTIKGWNVSKRLVTGRIPGRGPATECDGTCCRNGVFASIEERDRILRYAGRIQRMMDETQTKDPASWFFKRLSHDDEYPGGRCVGTRIHRQKCVFRTRERLCVLQKLEPTLNLPRGERLKPFYCRLFPLTTRGRCLDFDPLVKGKHPCCTLSARGKTRTLDAWAYEFKELLGLGGYRQLRARVRELPAVLMRGRSGRRGRA